MYIQYCIFLGCIPKGLVSLVHHCNYYCHTKDNSKNCKTPCYIHNTRVHSMEWSIEQSLMGIEPTSSQKRLLQISKLLPNHSVISFTLTLADSPTYLTHLQYHKQDISLTYLLNPHIEMEDPVTLILPNWFKTSVKSWNSHV